MSAKTIKIGDASIPLDSYVVSGTALLGTKGAGKTYAAKGIAEQLLDHDIPIVVFDPIGRWRFMKLAGDDSPKPRGYKIVVAGGEQPDLPLTAASAPEIVRAAIRENIPLVLDLYDRSLSKADWRRIVRSCFRTLLYENKGLRHVFLEETAEFAPQKVLDGETYAEVEKLVRMGGNASLGITLINQRSQEVNKAVLDLCDNLVLMRQRGSHAIDALEKWIDKLDPTSAKAIARAMPTMTAGEAWVFTGAAETATHVHTAPLRSFHPDRSKPQLTAAAAAARTADPAEFVTRLSAELGKLIEETRANDPAELRKRIAELERAAASKADGKEAVTRAEVDAAYKSGYDVGHEHGFGAGQQSAYRQFVALRETSERIRASLRAFRANVLALAGDEPDPDPLPEWQETASATLTVHPDPRTLKAATREALGEVARVMTRAVQRHGNGAGEPMPKANRALLTVLAQHPGGRTKVQLSVLSGYSIKSSSYHNALGALRSAGYVTRGAEPIRITPEGLAALGAYEPLPTGEALIQHWLGTLGKAERALLEVCVRHYPRALSKERLSEDSGYSLSSSSFHNALGRLRGLELVNRGAEIRASEELFG